MTEPTQTEEETKRRRRALLLLLLALLLTGLAVTAALLVGGGGNEGTKAIGSPAPSAPATTTPGDEPTTTTVPDRSPAGVGKDSGTPADPGTEPGSSSGGSSGGGTKVVVSAKPDPAPRPEPKPKPPGTPKITAGPDDPTNATGGTFSFTASDATSYLCSTDVAPAFVACTNPKGYPSGSFAEGGHTFQVKAVSAGGTSKAASYTWTVDLTPPPPPTFKLTPDNPNTKSKAHFEMRDAEKGVTYECSLDGAAYVTCKDNLELEGLSPGLHTFCVKAVDRAGNRSAPTCYTWQESSGGGGGGGGGPQPYTISGSISAPLTPGGAAQPIDVAFSSPNAGNGGSGVNGVRVSSLVVAITSVTGPNILPSRPCTAADFELIQFSGAYPFYVPQGTSTLSSLGFGSGTWPTLRLIDRPVNQDGCKKATIHLSYVGTP